MKRIIAAALAALILASAAGCSRTAPDNTSVTTAETAAETTVKQKPDNAGDADLSDGAMKFTRLYAEIGVPLVVANCPEGSTYKWTIDNQRTGKSRSFETAEPSYTPDAGDLESFISVSVDGTGECSLYFSRLPVVYITSSTAYYKVEKDKYVDAAISIQGNDLYWEGLYSGGAQIKLRGNSTAYRDKRPFKVRLDEKANLLGLGTGENRHWVLLANDIDHTLMRNKILNDLSGQLGTIPVMHSDNAALIYNGEYMGVYQVCEHVRIGESRVDVFDWEDYAEDAAKAISKAEGLDADALEAAMVADYRWVDTGSVKYNGSVYKFADYGLPALPAATGGWLLEMDFFSFGDRTLAQLVTAYNQPIYFSGIEYYDKKELDNFKLSSLYLNARNFIQSFEYALHADDFFFRNTDKHYTAKAANRWSVKYSLSDYYDAANAGKHYTEFFDIDSLVANFLFCEFAMNWDSMKNSFFVWKDIDGLAQVGPQWDFDWALGNRNMYGINTWYPESWHTTEDAFTVEQYYQSVQWNRMLIRDPYFLVLAYNKYKSVRDSVIEPLIKDDGIISQYAAYLYEAGEANDARWSKTYRQYRGELFSDALASMREFIDTRMRWMDKQFVSLETFVDSLGYYVPSSGLSVGSVSVDGRTVTATASVSDTSIATVTFQINGRTLVDAPVVGGVATVTVDVPNLGDVNCVEVKAKDSAGKYIVDSEHSDKGNYNMTVSNYKQF
jgi:hypothetical protein